uniref:NF-kappa-B inhibitor zeta n=1 Tax=Monopterus albus TaxID=43700 RepID=UPI0009B31033|nr:NF-kappa-B inhibitor zeta-like [Monopterus albus]
MLDSRGNDTRGNYFLLTGPNFSENSEGVLITDPRPPGYIPTMHHKNVLKELLMMRRQKWNCSHEDNNPEHKLKSAKLDMSPHQIETPPSVNPSTTCHVPALAPENEHSTLKQMQHSVLLGPMAPTAEVKMTLFHWQIQQEAQRVEGVSPELLNMQDADGDTFLHIAVAQGRRALAYVLAAKMAICGTLDVKEHNGQTALQIAAATDQHLIVQDLLAHGAQISTRDFWGRSPLHVCAAKGHFLSLQIRKIQKNKLAESLGHVFTHCEGLACNVQLIGLVNLALSGGGQSVDIEMFNYDGLTPLHVAVSSHNAVVKELRTLEKPCLYEATKVEQRRRMYVECVKTFLLMGAACGTMDLKSGRTCLHMAAEEANVELLKLFLDQSTSLSIVNAKTFSGNTALHIVSSLQNHTTQVDALKLLMRGGADPGARNFENELPSQLAPEGPTGNKVRQILKGKHVDV